MDRASRYETWSVRGKLQGKNGKKSKDVSGTDCATARGVPPRRPCHRRQEIVADDMIPLIDNSFEGKPLELDGEGVAYADGFFWVIALGRCACGGSLI